MSMLSIRFVKQKMKTNTYQNKGSKKQKVFKSFIDQFLHDMRHEKMDDKYLKRPGQKNNEVFFGDLDRTNSEENLEKIPNLFKEIKGAYQKKYNRKLHKQTKPTLNFLLTFEADFDLSEDKRLEQLKSVQRFIEKHFAYPLYLVQHNDEKALHYHFSVMNFGEDLKPISKNIDPSKLQDLIADHLKEDNQDYGHTRGESKTTTNSEHRTIMEGKILAAEEENELLKIENEKQRILVLEYKQEIEDIVSELVNLKNEKDLESFIKSLKRNIRNENKPKIEKLLKNVRKNKIDKVKKQEVYESNKKYTDSLIEPKKGTGTIGKSKSTTRNR